MQFYMDHAAMRKRVTDYTKREEGMPYIGDGPSYAASRKASANPRNVVGHAPGTAGIENLSTAADHGRAFPLAAEQPYPNEDASGRVHPVTSANYKPAHGGYPSAVAHPSAHFEIYFDAIKLTEKLRKTAHDAQVKVWRLETALRNYRMAETEDTIRVARFELERVYSDLV